MNQLEYIHKVILIPPSRVEVYLKNGGYIVFVITREGKFKKSAQSGRIGKNAFQEACREAGRAFAKMKSA